MRYRGPVAVAGGQDARVAELGQGRALGGLGREVAAVGLGLDGVGDEGADLGLEVGALASSGRRGGRPQT